VRIGQRVLPRNAASGAKKSMKEDALDEFQVEMVMPGGGHFETVPNTKALPYASIAALNAFSKSGNLLNKGTAWLITPKTFVTADHVTRRGAIKAESVELRPGWNGETPPAAGLFVSKCIVRHPSLDLALIVLDSELPFSFIPLKAHVMAPNDLKGRLAEISGYPTSIGNLAPDGRKPIRASDPIEIADDSRLRYRIDTGKGHSGAPIMLKDGHQAGRVVGVHLGEPNQQSPSHNFGVPLNASIITWLEAET
jgi:V8-like Glu-specific endopeptidase